MTTEETMQHEEAGRRVTDEPDEENSMDPGGESAGDSFEMDPFASPVSSSLSTVSARLRFELSLLAIPDRAPQARAQQVAEPRRDEPRRVRGDLARRVLAVAK